jgi:Fic/DOC family.
MISIIDIIEKRESLYSLAPFSDEIKNLKKKLDLLDFAYSDLRLYGSALTREKVQSILDGVTVPDAPVFEHRLCEAHRKLLQRFADKIDMGIDVDNAVLDEFCNILAGTKTPPFREGTPLLYHIDYVPGDEERMPSELANVFASVKRDERDGVFSKEQGGDFCLKAATLHGRIIKAYPYSDGFSEMAARVAMQYVIVQSGYFPIDIGISETEYNTILTGSLKSGNAAEFAELIRSAIFKQLNFLIDTVERTI